jgi:hypothetical protein
MNNPFDEATLEQEGARAAQAGRPWQSNPYLRRENMPQATGQTLREWSRKHDAWQRGFEGHATKVQQLKEALSEEAISDVIEHRLRQLPQVRAELEGFPYTVIRVELPKRHERDDKGRNWDVASFECGSLACGSCDAGFREEVDRIRDLYDLA